MESLINLTGNHRDLWYVIQTKPKKEEEAKSYLSVKGIEVFNPLMETFAQRNGRMNKELKPLFPNYIFGKFELERNYTLVKWARGVTRILGFGGVPAPVSEKVIEEIKSRSDGSGIVKAAYDFSPNDKVRIKSGPLRDLMGIFENWVPEKERVRILLNLIGYQPSVEIHCSMIEKLA
jgi:transcriptional antiterminator RfaH